MTESNQKFKLSEIGIERSSGQIPEEIYKSAPHFFDGAAHIYEIKTSGDRWPPNINPKTIRKICFSPNCQSIGVRIVNNTLGHAHNANIDTGDCFANIGLENSGDYIYVGTDIPDDKCYISFI